MLYINKKFRFKVLIKAKNPLFIQNYLINKEYIYKPISKVKIKIDIDPYNLY